MVLERWGFKQIIIMLVELVICGVCIQIDLL